MCFIYILNSLEKISVASIFLYFDDRVVSVLHFDDVEISSMSNVIVILCTFFVADVWNDNSSNAGNILAPTGLNLAYFIVSTDVPCCADVYVALHTNRYCRRRAT